MDVKVKIDDPVLRSYLGGLFEKRDGGYAVNMDTATGTLICSLAQAVDYPPRRNDDEETTVRFFLARSRYNDSLRNKNLVVTREGEAKINAMLRKEFEVNFYNFCSEGRIQGFKLRDVIAVFISKNNMDIFDGNIETLKKRYYRREVELLKKVDLRLHDLAYRTARHVRKTMNNEVMR